MPNNLKGPASLIVILVVIALYVLILPDAKRPYLNKFLKGIHDFLKIKKLIIESIFRFLYVVSVVSCVVFGIFLLFSDIENGLELLILGPIACRVVFELLLMTVLLVKNVMEINNQLKGIDEPTESKKSNVSVESILSTVGKKLQDISATQSTAQSDVQPTVQPEVTHDKICKKCGKSLPVESDFCIYCGTKIE